jgi:predicted amidophosphoribosyltransferase
LVVRTVKDEIFRNGIAPKPNWTYKCVVCDKEFSEDRVWCDECGGKLKEPNDEEHKLQLHWIRHNKNSYGQTFIDVMKEIEMDIDKHDNGFMFLAKRYIFDEDERTFN